MGSMKIFSIKTALHIAVFLSLITAGCYTTLRPPSKIAQSESQQYQPSAWDFGHAWYDENLYYTTSHYYYHSVPWWYGGRHRNQDTSEVAPAQPEPGGGKITLRDFGNPVSGNYVAPLLPYPTQPNVPDSATNSGAPADSSARPIINQMNDTNNTNDNSNKEDSTGKINRRGRR
jgi:hypothetical protein